MKEEENSSRKGRNLCLSERVPIFVYEKNHSFSRTERSESFFSLTKVLWKKLLVVFFWGVFCFFFGFWGSKMFPNNEDEQPFLNDVFSQTGLDILEE